MSSGSRNSSVGDTPPRYPVEIVRRLAPPSPARVAGRVVDVGSTGVRITDVTGSVWVEAEAPLPPLGAWVSAEGNWNGQRLQQGVCRLLNAPRVAFPPPHGEWNWFQDDDGRRAKLLRKRAILRRAIREFFDQRAFVEVETPLVVPSPGLEVHLDALEVHGMRRDGGAAYLVTSPEYQMKRLLAGGLPRIYQLGRCFRAGELGHLHQPEFSMLEWYRAFSGAEEVMRDTEALVAHVAAAVGDGSTVIPGAQNPVDVAPPWRRVTVAEAFQKYAGADAHALAQQPTEFFRRFVEQVQPQLGRFRPIFLTEWPASMASLASLDPRNPSVAQRFEAFVDGVELCNGFNELIDPVEQRQRLAADQQERNRIGKPQYPIDQRFLEALEEGLPPCGGNALGFDRLVMLVLGVADISDVVAIPASRA